MLEIDKFKKLINEHKFFEAHEALEEYWFPRRKSKSREVLIVKGFINSAVSLELKKRGRDEASKRVWKTYEKLTSTILPYEQEFIELKKFMNNFKKEYLGY